ncbi:phosphodiester glycosidase family protein [Hymenobacter sp. BT664]|uniref:Phosphodiester glycosidase family protein n=2 Tax=Hymenobacter montanus TaxID=2771359 RepID=A0A927BE52_9BACT|nr:phosphodiester glycosidase family protein [Hymenobacter montanus]
MVATLATGAGPQPKPSLFVSYRVDLRRTTCQLYWKDDKNRRFQSLRGLKSWLDARGQKLLFAMNAGMFDAAYAPQGLFIQDGRTIKPLDTATGHGNFYLKPNGVFYLTTKGSARICKTEDFLSTGAVTYATQSGPLLVIDGDIHPAFQPGSANVQIRNGVGILPDQRLLLAMSKAPINFYDFANYFRRAGCRQALYLDGFVSRTYAPSQNWTQLDGDVGVMLGVTVPALPPGPAGH